MTQEEKAKAYDEALEKAKFYHGNCPSEPERKKLEKMFPVLRESEDERIRMALCDIVRDMPYMETELRAHGLTVEKVIAYLEKQKEQKFVECIEFANEFKNQVSHLLASVLNGEHEYNAYFVKYAAQSLLGYAKEEQKPAEWSEEDEKKIESIKGLITTGRFADTNTIRTIWKLLDSLSPRPSWKPSEEQMRALVSARFLYRDGLENSETASALESLCVDLNKLRYGSTK